jgi:hypothetical protein
VRLFVIIVIGLGLAAGDVQAQTATNVAGIMLTNSAPALTNTAAEKLWSFSAFAYTYLVPEGRNYTQPTVTANRGWLHLEARYNYEGFDTGSAWIGYNFHIGEKLSLEFTPMLGGVFGDTTGIAPGYEYTLSWRKLELYSEGEYLFDTGNSSDNFFYTWSELTLAPRDWFRFGLVVQRSKTFQNNLAIERGLLVGFSYRRVSFTTCVFNPDSGRPIVMLGVGLTF